MSNAPATNTKIISSLEQQIDIRPLTAKDTAAYRMLRNKIRQSDDARFFSDSYTREDQLSENQWPEWCTKKPEHCIFGTFVNGELVGIIMVTQYGPPEDHTAEWEASWLAPQYRKTGITPTVYEKIKQWTADQGYTKVKVFIRADNSHWLNVRKKQGFVQIGTKTVRWADGSDATMCIFSLDLQAPALNQRHQQTLDYLEEVHSSLNEEEKTRGALPTRDLTLKAALG